jgi:antitoxin VapB
MGMNIKDPQVHAMARELASRRGTSVADAVRQVLAAELSRSTQPSADARKASRLEAIHQIQARFAALPRKDPCSSDALQNELDDNDLPI